MGFKRIAFMFILACAIVFMGHHATPDGDKNGGANAAPILLPGDNAGVGCGTDLHLNKKDFDYANENYEDTSSYSLGCDAEVQVSKVKLFAGIKTLSGVDIGELGVNVGFVAPLGDNARLSVELDGNTGYKVADGLDMNGSVTVSTRVAMVF